MDLRKRYCPGEKLTWPAGFSGSRMINPGSRSFPLKIGHVLLVDTSTPKVNKEMDFGIDIAFGESGIVEGESVLETVQGMFDAVRNLGNTFGPLVL